LEIGRNLSFLFLLAKINLEASGLIGHCEEAFHFLEDTTMTLHPLDISDTDVPDIAMVPKGEFTFSTKPLGKASATFGIFSNRDNLPTYR